MFLGAIGAAAPQVVPLAGDVDRNVVVHDVLHGGAVVPLAGDVDRNKQGATRSGKTYVVPLAGDVDRNVVENIAGEEELRVVPLAGDVDRNLTAKTVAANLSGRPPRGGRG